MAEEVKTNETNGTEEKKEDLTVKELEKKLAEISDQLNKTKQAFNNASSDAASWKQKFRDTQDEATRKEAEREEELAALRQKVADNEKRMTIATHKAAFLAMGYPDELAEKKASFLADNDVASAIGVEKEFLTFHDKEAKAASVRQTTAPASGFQTSGSITKEAFSRMSIRERSELRAKDPNLYEELINKK